MPLSPHQTALNGPPGAVKVRGEEEEREVSMDSCATPDGPLARTMNESIKQIRKQINAPRKSASETKNPFRSRVRHHYW